MTQNETRKNKILIIRNIGKNNLRHKEYKCMDSVIYLKNVAIIDNEQKYKTYKRAFDEILEQIKIAQVHVYAFKTKLF